MTGLEVCAGKTSPNKDHGGDGHGPMAPVWFAEPGERLFEDAAGARLELRGVGVSPGVALGSAFIYRDLFQRHVEQRQIAQADVAEESDRIDQAVEEVLHSLGDTARQIENEVDAEHAAIFQAHADMLRSNSVRRELRDELQRELLNAEQAVARVFQRIERRFQECDHSVFQDRADDVADIASQLLASLAGVHVQLLECLPEGSILVARRLLPSDTVALARRRTAGVVLEHAGMASHAALLARELGIPAVGQISYVTEQIRPDEKLLVDGFSGAVVVQPPDKLLAEFEARQSELTSSIRLRRETACTPAVTPDGTAVQVFANVGSAEDVQAAIRFGADGIGLFRTEFLYLGRGAAPTEQELYDLLHHALAPMSGRPITLRLLDVGGDKHPPFLSLPMEPDPALGRRGIRLLRDYADVLSAQLKAFLRLSKTHDVRILVPMVTLEDDVEWVRAVMLAAANELGVERLPPLGAMVETPAAALCTEMLAKHADFFSIGTNDLTQYTMAAARENALVADYYAEAHPSIIRLIEASLRGASGKPVSVCGEAAARPALLNTLLHLGIRMISAAPPAVPFLKEAIRTVKPGDLPGHTTEEGGREMKEVGQ